MVWADIAVSPNPVGVNQLLLINAWIEPMPDIGWVFADMMIEVTKPDSSVVQIGPKFSYGSGTIFATYTPDQIGQYSAKLKWPGGDHTADYLFNPKAPLQPYMTNVESDPYSFTVQANPVVLFEDYALPGPNEYWERPIPSEYREWAKIAGNYLYPSGFGDTWRNDGTGNKHINPYSTAPNTAHIAWDIPATMGGLVGDTRDSIAYGRGEARINIIMDGIGYYQLNGLHAVDIRTGEELWVNEEMTRNPTFGQNPTRYIGGASASGAGGSISFTQPKLWYIGNVFEAYDASTGNLISSYESPEGFQPDPNIPATGNARATVIDIDRTDGGVLLYQTYSGSVDRNATWITCWNSNKPGTTFEDKLEWYAEDLEAESGSGPYLIPGKYVLLGRSGNPDLKCYDALTGELVWHKRMDTGADPFIVMSEGGIDGGRMKLYYPCSTDEKVRSIDVATGNIEWVSAARDYPWGSWSAYSAAVAYGKFYVNSYDGFYAYDTATGNVAWKYQDFTTETPYGTYAFYGRPYVADGKIYTQEYEHSPSEPLYRGQRMFAFDANNGDVLWTFPMQGQGMAGADGMVISTDAYTGTTFGFGKGKTETTVTVSSGVVAQGSSVLIEGTILDMSNAQPGTPCVSKESMTAWMEYIHTPRPMPSDVTGVPVQLTAVSSGGSVVELGTVISDMNGDFKMLWDEPTKNLYTITASFNGDESYWPSWDAAGLGVTEAPSANGPIEPEPTEAPWMTTEVAIIAAVAVIAVVGIVAFWALRKRK